MSGFLLEHEPQLRLSVFMAVLLLIGGWEFLAPRRARTVARALRWPANLGITLLNTVALRVVFPLTLVQLAMLAGQRQWGLLNQFAVPELIAALATILVLDLLIWAQHLLFHKVPVLWRLHRMHHADIDLDVTSGARFHTLEILLSMLIKMGVVILLGAPPVAVLLFEILLSATAMFNHGNIRIPQTWDRVLRMLIVTPDMHRIHHSWVPAETNSNYGFNLSCWDRWFGTYTGEPAAGQLGLTIGLHQFRAPDERRLLALLSQPFR